MSVPLNSGSGKSSAQTAMLVVVFMTVFSVAFASLTLALDAIAPDPEGESAISGEEVLDEPFYLLLIGSDSRKGTALYTGRANEHSQLDQRADIMTLMRVDPREYVITLVTVPRDTVLAGEDQKINETLSGGDPESTVDAVERLTGVSVDYYMMTTFTEFDALIDAIGGVVADVPLTVTVPDPMTGKDLELAKGDDRNLDGSQALVLARARKEYVEDQDALRQVNVRNLELSIIDKALSVEVPGEENDGISSEALMGYIGSLEENVSTNMDSQMINYLVSDFAAHGDEITLFSCTGPYEGDTNEAGVWTIPEDEGTWSALMAVVDAGENPEGMVEEPRFS